MQNDAPYWFAFSLLITAAFSFMLGRVFERADRWLLDRDAERRAIRAAIAARDALMAPPKPRRTLRARFAALGRTLANFGMPGRELQVWR